MDLISREAAIDAIDHEREMLINQGRNGVERVVAHHARRLIKDMPTVDAAPVVHGQWIHCKGKSNLWYCSVCGEKIIYNPTRKTYKPDKKPVWEINKYCRNCGALMKVGEEDEST